MTRLLITGSNRGIGPALFAAAQAAGPYLGWVRTDMGGVDADENQAVVSAGMLSIADRLTTKDAARFFHFTGEEREF